MLNIQNLEAGYGGSAILRGINIQVEPGQVVCLMGRNGVGKTTLLKSIMGLLRPSRGTIGWNDGDITRHSTDRRARSGIGYVPQGREIFPQLSVEENLLLGLEASPIKTPRRQRESVPDIAFDMFPMLGKMLHRKGGTLSGGQQQQLAIGRVLIAQPKLILMDEPMEGIQPSVVHEIERAIEKIKSQRQIAVLLVEQSLEFATRVADSYYILDKGSVVAEGKSGELSDDVVRRHLTV
jgi:urea transport system ATP-binding protein